MLDYTLKQIVTRSGDTFMVDEYIATGEHGVLVKGRWLTRELDPSQVILSFPHFNIEYAVYAAPQD